MYIDNVKKLFKDIQSIPTMMDYMEAVIDDGMEDDLANLISIVQCYSGQLHDGAMEGSLRWDLSQCETEKERQQMIEDDRAMTRILRRLNYELSSMYIMVCGNCGTAYFYKRWPRYLKADDNISMLEHYVCGECRKEKTLAIYTTQSYLCQEGQEEATRYLTHKNYKSISKKLSY